MVEASKASDISSREADRFSRWKSLPIPSIFFSRQKRGKWQERHCGHAAVLARVHGNAIPGKFGRRGKKSVCYLPCATGLCYEPKLALDDPVPTCLYTFLPARRHHTQKTSTLASVSTAFSEKTCHTDSKRNQPASICIFFRCWRYRHGTDREHGTPSDVPCVHKWTKEKSFQEITIPGGSFSLINKFLLFLRTLVLHRS